MSSLIIVPGEDKDILEREIDVVQTLLDEQPDSKCQFPVARHPRSLTNALVVYVGCMDSLVAYKLLFLKNHVPAGSQGSTDAMSQCLTLLGQLEELDPMRRQRYRDMGGSSLDEYPHITLTRVTVGAQLEGQ
jgi:geranylgeranyl transferase type-2 subunit alpha